MPSFLFNLHAGKLGQVTNFSITVVRGTKHCINQYMVFFRYCSPVKTESQSHRLRATVD